MDLDISDILLHDEFIRIQRYDDCLKKNGIIGDDQFYTKEFLEWLAETKDEEEDLDDLRQAEIEEMELERVEFSLDSVMRKVVDELEIYEKIYTTPPVKISMRAWNCFFETTFTYYEEKGFIGLYDEDMIFLGRLAIAHSMLYQKDFLEISDYQDSISFLDSRVLTEEQKEELKEEVEKTLNPDPKVISFEKYKKKREQNNGKNRFRRC